MTIHDIEEVKNPTGTIFKPIKEKQNIYVPDIVNQNISRRNGMIYVMTGSGGSGKTNLLLNMFKSKSCYRNIFNNIYYFCPAASFASLKNHPFEKHDKVYHELTVSLLEEIYNELVSKRVDDKESKVEKRKRKEKYGDTESSGDESEEEKEIEYSVVILDDMADQLKDKHIQRQLNKMLIKARHLCCSFIFTLQTYLYFPKSLRKQITYITMFKSKNIEEFNSIVRELLNYNKDDALLLFNYVFNESYVHLDMDTVENRLYKNFNELLIK
jgi:type II secretory ATPase GspE/PulE/Tfp pilus assembly ATPase PilB-like protein